jgi:hypothetical protein
MSGLDSTTTPPETPKSPDTTPNSGGSTSDQQTPTSPDADTDQSSTPDSASTGNGNFPGDYLTSVSASSPNTIDSGSKPNDSTDKKHRPHATPHPNRGGGGGGGGGGGHAAGHRGGDGHDDFGGGGQQASGDRPQAQPAAPGGGDARSSTSDGAGRPADNGGSGSTSGATTDRGSPSRDKTSGTTADRATPTSETAGPTAASGTEAERDAPTTIGTAAPTHTETVTSPTDTGPTDTGPVDATADPAPGTAVLDPHVVPTDLAAQPGPADAAQPALVPEAPGPGLVDTDVYAPLDPSGPLPLSDNDLADLIEPLPTGAALSPIDEALPQTVDSTKENIDELAEELADLATGESTSDTTAPTDTIGQPGAGPDDPDSPGETPDSAPTADPTLGSAHANPLSPNATTPPPSNVPAATTPADGFPLSYFASQTSAHLDFAIAVPADTVASNQAVPVADRTDPNLAAKQELTQAIEKMGGPCLDPTKYSESQLLGEFRVLQAESLSRPPGPAGPAAGPDTGDRRTLDDQIREYAQALQNLGRYEKEPGSWIASGSILSGKSPADVAKALDNAQNLTSLAQAAAAMQRAPADGANQRGKPPADEQALRRNGSPGERAPQATRTTDKSPTTGGQDRAAQPSKPPERTSRTPENATTKPEAPTPKPTPERQPTTRDNTTAQPKAQEARGAPRTPTDNTPSTGARAADKPPTTGGQDRTPQPGKPPEHAPRTPEKTPTAKPDQRQPTGDNPNAGAQPAAQDNTTAQPKTQEAGRTPRTPTDNIPGAGARAPQPADQAHTIWGQGSKIQGRGAEDWLARNTPGTHFNGNFPQFDSAVYGPGGPHADAVEARQLKSVDTGAKTYLGDGLRSQIVKAAGDIPSGGTWESKGHTVTIGPDTKIVLDVAMPTKPLNPAQETALAEAKAQAASMGVEVRVHRIP